MSESPHLPVRGGRHARIEFDSPASNDAEIIIEHWRKKLLALERRPLPARASSLDVKTHPRATFISCQLVSGNDPVPDVAFSVSCGEKIEPIGRYFIVIGAMKSGTTSLFRTLSRHPELCQTRVEVPGISFTKEINYFNDLYRKGHGPLHYDWRFPFDPSRHAWTLDVSPNYAKLPKSRPIPKRIAMLGGEIKLAYILRNPVDRIESQIAHAIQHDGAKRGLRHCTRISRYARHLDRFTRHIPREDILLLDFEELRQNPNRLFKRVCDFLDIEPIQSDPRVYNRGSVDYRLTNEDRAGREQRLRMDVQRLISKYDFAPARQWLDLS